MSKQAAPWTCTACRSNFTPHGPLTLLPAHPKDPGTPRIPEDPRGSPGIPGDPRAFPGSPGLRLGSRSPPLVVWNRALMCIRVRQYLCLRAMLREFMCCLATGERLNAGSDRLLCANLVLRPCCVHAAAYLGPRTSDLGPQDGRMLTFPTHSLIIASRSGPERQFCHKDDDSARAPRLPRALAVARLAHSRSRIPASAEPSSRSPKLL